MGPVRLRFAARGAPQGEGARVTDKTDKMVMGRWPTLHDENQPGLERELNRRRDFLSKPRGRSGRFVAETTVGASGRLGAGRGELGALQADRKGSRKPCRAARSRRPTI